jgi:hypothetical protein
MYISFEIDIAFFWDYECMFVANALVPVNISIYGVF